MIGFAIVVIPPVVPKQANFFEHTRLQTNMECSF